MLCTQVKVNNNLLEAKKVKVLEYVAIFGGYFLIWTLYSYWVHRLAHIPSKRNILFKIHIEHHKAEYGNPSWPRWQEYFLWYGNWRASADVWITLMLPGIVISIFDPLHGLPMLIFLYLYEVFLGGDVLDHNPNIDGRLTRILALGQYHLRHHRNVRKNYSFYITLWDYVFRTHTLKDVRQKKNRAA